MWYRLTALVQVEGTGQANPLRWSGQGGDFTALMGALTQFLLFQGDGVNLDPKTPLESLQAADLLIETWTSLKSYEDCARTERFALRQTRGCALAARYSGAYSPKRSTEEAVSDWLERSRSRLGSDAGS